MKDVNTLTFALQAFVTLIVILDPPGNAPIFLAVLGDRSAKEGRQLRSEEHTSELQSH